MYGALTVPVGSIATSLPLVDATTLRIAATTVGSRIRSAGYGVSAMEYINAIKETDFKSKFLQLFSYIQSPLLDAFHSHITKKPITFLGNIE
jgi:hypothetical protein